ncbi:MAG: hypothetical protein JXQ87_12325 [Bacteroidia bacterium]
MKTLRINFLPAIALVALLFGAVACNEDSIEASLSDSEYSIAEEELAISEFEHAAGHHADFMMAKELRGPACDDWKTKLPECATVTESGDDFPKTTVIEFGDDCQDKHGRTRTGKVVIVQTDNMKNIGAKRTVTFEHFGMNERTIKGIKILENSGENLNGNLVFKRTVTINGSGEKGNFERVSENEIEWLQGFDTEDCYDNIISISGSSTSYKDEEEMGSRTILKPIIRDFECEHPLSGTVEMDGKRGAATIDFGDGACDQYATLTTNEGTKEIDLDKKRNRRKGKGNHH